MSSDLVPVTSNTVVRDSPLNHFTPMLVETLDDALDLKRWLGERRETPVGIDTESTGLDSSRDTLRLIQVGDKRTGWAIPYPLWGGLAQELVNSYEGQWVAHNAQFDWRFLTKSGCHVPWHRLDDTMLMAGLLDPTSPKGLKPLSSRLVDKNATAGERLLHDGMTANKWTWATVPYGFTPYTVYAALDPVLTVHLWEKLRPAVTDRGLNGVYELELGVARLAADMMTKGIKVDRNYVSDKIYELNEYIAQTRGWLKEQHNVTSLMASKQIARAFGEAGLSINRTTPTGMPKVDKETLDAISKHDLVPTAARELAATVLKARHAEKVRGSYLENFLTLCDSDDVVHPQINTMQARTGRMSITEPALQTLHRDDTIVRGSFIPRPGYVFITCDFSQVEMRLAAALAEDQGLIDAFAEADRPGGNDFYSTIASDLFGEPVPKKDKRRQAVKSMSYAKLYGASVGTMARTAGVTVSEMTPIKDAFESRFPGLNHLAIGIANKARQLVAMGERPATWTTLGRYAPCDAGREFALINYRIQAEAADVLKQSILRLEAAGFRDAMLLPVHDEMILEVLAENAEDALPVVVSAMEDRETYPIPLTCEGAVLPERWKKA